MDREEQREILKWLLGQAFRAENHERQLKKRLARIRQEIDNPIGAIKYNAMPKAASGGNRMEDLVADLTEIEGKIVDQMKAVSEAKLRVMEIIEFIPIHEVSRQILELRHIDLLDWYQIAEEIPMSRQKCSKHHREALEALLEYPEIQAKVKAAEPDYTKWKAKKGIPPKPKK